MKTGTFPVFPHSCEYRVWSGLAMAESAHFGE